MQNREVKSGEFYRHWKTKGNTYEVVDIAEPFSMMTSGSHNIQKKVQAVYTEENNPIIDIYYTDKGVFANWNERLVLYRVAILNEESPLAQDEERQHTLWAREYGMFTEDVTYEDGTQGPRFRKAVKP